MDVDTRDIRDFLSHHHPFDLLPPDVVAALPRRIQTLRIDQGGTVIEPGQESRFLALIREGAVEIQSPEGQLLIRLGEGEAFGLRALLGDGKAAYRATALEDTTLLLLPGGEFARLHRTHPIFAQYFTPSGADRLRSVHDDRSHDRINLMALRARELMTTDPVIIAPEASVREAAQTMRDHRISCLPVVDGTRLVGVVTNVDLRDRVLAEAVDLATPVRAIMTPDPIWLSADRLGFDALLTMTRSNISHLPVVDNGTLVGVITNTNLVRRQAGSAVYMVGDIHTRQTAEGIAEVVAQVPLLLTHLVDDGASADRIGHIITSICDATTNRLLQLAEERLGPPPVPYVWLASGSQARQEQTGVSDQDNCLVIDDHFDEDRHGAYFTRLATDVCDGLNTAGYVYCPGEMMAMTPKWRKPLAQWRRYFANWIAEPEPMAQMLTSVLFDLRPVRGEVRLFEQLRSAALAQAKANSIFIAHLASNALTHTPPLGFFRNFVLIRGGEHDQRLDLKHSGVVPIVDIARVYSLKAGIEAVNTVERLSAAREAGVISESGARDLLDAFEFIAMTRLKHQVRQIRTGAKPDNFVAPETLPRFDRSHLKDAFDVVKTMQASMASIHHIGVR